MRSARENGLKCVGEMHRKAHPPSRERLVTARRLGSTFVILIRTRILVQRRGKHDPLCNAESKGFLGKAASPRLRGPRSRQPQGDARPRGRQAIRRHDACRLRELADHSRGPVAEGNGMATQYTFSGTHRDELMGIPLPETG